LAIDASTDIFNTFSTLINMSASYACELKFYLERSDNVPSRTKVIEGVSLDSIARQATELMLTQEMRVEIVLIKPLG